jgi:hypothetical protein
MESSTHTRRTRRRGAQRFGDTHFCAIRPRGRVQNHVLGQHRHEVAGVERVELRVGKVLRHYLCSQEASPMLCCRLPPGWRGLARCHWPGRLDGCSPRWPRLKPRPPRTLVQPARAQGLGLLRRFHRTPRKRRRAARHLLARHQHPSVAHHPVFAATFERVIGLCRVPVSDASESRRAGAKAQGELDDHAEEVDHAPSI